MKAVKIMLLILLPLVILAGLGVYFLSQPVDKPVVANIGVTHYAGPYKVQLKLNPEKPKIGNNQVTFQVRNEQDQPVNNAQIEAVAVMPAMGTMPEMRETVEIEASGAGLYQGQFSLPMNGSWPITVTINSTALGKAELGFDMNTSRAGLKLTGATASALAPQAAQAESAAEQLDTFTVDSYRRQLIGVTTSEVLCQNMLKTIRAAARVNYDESRLADINLKYDGWIGTLNADFVGKQINKGEQLFTVYNPELVSAQDEYLSSLRRKDAGPYSLQKAARTRLARWDISSAEIRALAKRGKVSEYLPILAPMNGTIIEKNIVAGAAVKAGTRLLRLADLSSVWIEGEVYEAELPWIKVGMAATVSFPEMPEQTYNTVVSFIEPVLNPKTRTAKVRVAVPNPEGILKPGMYARLNLQVDLGERLVVPEQAVIYAGEQRVVFLDKGEGRLQPRKIKTGVRNEGFIEVLEGLEFGDVVVTSGNFLIAAESKFKSGLAQW